MVDLTARTKLLHNLQCVQDAIAEAIATAGRPSECVRLVAVTKSIDVDIVRALYEAGCTELGEGRPQQLWSKHELLRDLPIHWHLIGHLQRNKVKRTVPLVRYLHSVDSLELLQDIHHYATLDRSPVDVLLEVNISGDETKHGIAPASVEVILNQATQLDRVRIDGLMAMASLYGGRDQARRDFAKLRELRDDLVRVSGIPLPELSMGMSQDFDLAILEGSTMVRVGSRLFEGLS
ncbi:MAG: YggS family pyridoxal phosphate-dependent enzyme [Planctomycetota bacterium]|nr:YggS family pyridoxal phosphate-dependent enzyme [Planctomycetota bacterium]MDA1179555.1 YggS family pyridoxal phosphate-dependent enzyme [Planctomycetota bacterium]